MRDAWAAAIQLLSHREHGEQELRDKLLARQYELAAIETALEKCKHLDLQNDNRYAESFCRMRIRQGYGPLKIRQELLHKGIDRHLVEELLQQESGNWFTYAQAVWKKKTRLGKDSLDIHAVKKIQRFLLQKGFSAAVVMQVANAMHEADLSEFE